KQDERQANHLILQRRHVAIIPEYHPKQHKPVVHPQRAKVVGPSGEEIHVDAWGRIKVRFLFTRVEDHSHDSGAGSNDNDTDSAWVDVLTPWAGEGYGMRLHPRIDEMVVIDFFDGDIDRPFVLGRIHEGQRHPVQFDQIGQLPETKVLSGIKTKEYKGTGYNQLRFNDTTGQISSQLHSSHGASQLNLGKLSHPKKSADSAERGEGFELRTDQWGALRAGQGLLISTYAQSQATGQHLESSVAKQQFKSSHDNSQVLSEVAKNQQTDPIQSVEQLKAFAAQLEQDIAKFNQALLLLSSPDGIGLSTAQDIHLCANGQINQTAGSSINVSTQSDFIAHAHGKISALAIQGGIKAVSAKEKVEIAAHNNAISVLARLGIDIQSTEDKIILRSKKGIELYGGTSSLKIDEKIELKTPAQIELKAAQHAFLKGEKAEQPDIQQENKPSYLRFKIADLEGKPAKNVEYMIFRADGGQHIGVTDASGHTQMIQTEASEKVSLHISDKNAAKFQVCDED
ncbi:DUF2345 domain-containing protein, partial [Acinetobacter boissieri]